MNYNRLRAKIKERGLTQAEVAKLAGMSCNSLSRKLSGKRDFRLNEVGKICEVLEVENPCDLFFANFVPSAQRSACRQ